MAVRNRGFTLLEVVLAIGLAGVVIGLLTTALDLYMMRVDSSRTQVESAQLARTLLNQIADDLRAARYYSPNSSSSSEGSPDAADESTSTGSTETADSTDLTLVQGIFGTQTELRIDRSAIWRWELLAQEAEQLNAQIAADIEPEPTAMPQTVRYVLGEGKELLAKKMAAEGVNAEPTAAGYAGLYREQLPTAAWLAKNAATSATITATSDSADAELIAPEVVAIEFGYFDGQQLLTAWDSSLQGGLPLAVEIRLTLLREPFELAVQRTTQDRDELRQSKENLVEYRLVVRLPYILAAEDAEFPQSDSSGDGGGGGDGASGTGEGGQPPS